MSLGVGRLTKDKPTVPRCYSGHCLIIEIACNSFVVYNKHFSVRITLEAQFT